MSIDKLQKVICIALMFFSALSSFKTITADSRISHIRELYRQANKLECEVGCEHSQHRIQLNTMLPAIGLQTTTIRFIFTSNQKDPEQDPYWLTHTLHKVLVTYNIAASVNYTIEYLYDTKEEPVFYFWQEKINAGTEKQEKRYYFHKSKLIKAILDCKTDSGDPLNYSMTKRFKAEDVSQAKFLIKKSHEYRKLFKTLLKAEQLR